MLTTAILPNWFLDSNLSIWLACNGAGAPPTRVNAVPMLFSQLEHLL